MVISSSEKGMDISEKTSVDIFADTEKFFTAIKGAKKSYESLNYIFKKALNDFETSIYNGEIKNWDKKDKLTYLESTSRFAVAGSNPWIFDVVSSDYLLERMRQEHLRMDGKIFQHKTEAHDLLFQNNARAVAFQSDSNSAGMARDLPERLKVVAEKYLADGDKEAVEALVNPYQLKSGTEVLWRNEGDEEITIKPLTDVQIEGVEGLVMLGEEVWELEEINKKLIGGELMLKNGDNEFGGVGLLKLRLKYDSFPVSSVLTIDITSPFEREGEIKTAKVKVVKNNFTELEDKYGLAFLKFIWGAPQGRPLAVVDLENESGSIAKDWDMRNLKIISKE